MQFVIFQNLGRNEYQFSLMIDDEVTQDHLQSFDLSVANDIGKKDMSIGLHEEGMYVKVIRRT